MNSMGKSGETKRVSIIMNFTSKSNFAVESDLVKKNHSTGNSSKKKSNSVELETKIKMTCMMFEMSFERLDLSTGYFGKYKIGNFDYFLRRPISNSIENNTSARPAKDQISSNQLQVQTVRQKELKVIDKHVNGSRKGRQNNCPPIEPRRGLKKRRIVKEVPHIPPLRILDVGDKEKHALKRRRISDADISPSIKLKPTPEDLTANSKSLIPEIIDLTNDDDDSSIDDVVDPPLTINPKEGSKIKFSIKIEKEEDDVGDKEKHALKRRRISDTNIRSPIVKVIKPTPEDLTAKSKPLIQLIDLTNDDVPSMDGVVDLPPSINPKERSKKKRKVSPKLKTQFRPKNASPALNRRPKVSSAASVGSASLQQRNSKRKNVSAKCREDKSRIDAMIGADSALPRRIARLPRIPKKDSAINSNRNTPKTSSLALAKVTESKGSSPLSNLKSSLAIDSKANDSSRRTQHLAKASKLARINLLVNKNLASSEREPYNPFRVILDLPTAKDANIVSVKPSADKPIDDNPTKDELLPTVYHGPYSLSVDPQDDALPIRLNVDDSDISFEEEAISSCSRNNVQIVPKRNSWIEKYETSVLQDTTYFYKHDISESMAPSDMMENLRSDQNEAETKIYSEPTKRHYFDQELSKMDVNKLEKKMSELTDNFKKCLMVFEHIKKKFDSDVPMFRMQKVFATASKCIDCSYISQEDTVLFLKTVGDCISWKANVSEKIKILVALLNWLNTFNRTTKGSHWTFIGRHVEFSNLVSLFNQVLAVGINTDRNDSVISLYRAGSVLHLPMDASVIRALVSRFASSNMLSACQNVYNLGCQLGVYKCLKIRKWPVVLFVRSYYTVDEIRIILLELLLKLDKLLSTNYFIDLGVNINDDFSLFIRFEELKFEDFSAVTIKFLSSIRASTLSDVFERFKMVLSSMGESILDHVTVDQKRTILRIEKPLLEKLLKFAKVHVKNKIVFIDHNKPTSSIANALAYKKLTATGIYCQYNDNPFLKDS